MPRVPRAVADDLGRVDRTVAARLGISALALRVAWGRERVFPAQIIPVVDRQGQRKDGGIFREVAQKCIGRRAGRASLARKKLKDRSNGNGSSPGRAAGRRHHLARDGDIHTGDQPGGHRKASRSGT